MDEEDGIFNSASHVEGILGVTRLSTGTQGTLATTTTRGSSVMPAASPNLCEKMKNMTAEQALDHFKESEVGKANNEATGNQILNQQEAASLNRDAVLKKRKESLAANNRTNLKKGALVGLVVFVVLVMIIGISVGVSNNNADENEEDLVEINRNRIFTNINDFEEACEIFPEAFRELARCHSSDETRVCIDGVLREGECDRACDDDECENDEIFRPSNEFCDGGRGSCPSNLIFEIPRDQQEQFLGLEIFRS